MPNRQPDQVPPAGSTAEHRATAEAVGEIKDHAIFRMDARGRAVTWNEGVRNVLGFHREEFIGADVVSLIWPPEDVASGSAQGELDTAARHGTAGDDRWMIRKSGERFWAMGTTTALHNDAGAVVGFSKVMRDLTGFKRLHDELTTRTWDLAQANEELRDMTDLIAHDLKEPLRGILFHIKVLEEDFPLPAAGAERRAAIRKLAERLQALINGMLEMSKASRGELRLAPEPLTSLMAEAAEQVEGLRAQRGGIVRWQPGMPALECDAGLLRQALANLISNGLKYNNSPTPTVEVSAEREEGAVVVRVSDNGIGIPAPELESVFRLFKRLHARDAYGGGTGVGLPLVRRIVERHGGRIRAESRVDEGTTFVMTFPAGKSAG